MQNQIKNLETKNTFVAFNDLYKGKEEIVYFNAPNLLKARKWYANAITLEQWNNIVKQNFTPLTQTY
jgi:hypothetical protein